MSNVSNRVDDPSIQTDRITILKKNCRTFLVFKSFGLFYRLNGDDAILVSYLFDINIKNHLVHISRDKINSVLEVLNKIGIDYYYNGYWHNFENNKYQYYYEYAIEKNELKKFIGDLWKIN